MVVSRTLYKVLEEAAERYGKAPALRQPQPGRDGYITRSWLEYKRQAEEIAAGLRALGLVKGDVVALNSDTRMEFYLADMGILAAGCLAAALYPSYLPKDLVRMLEGTSAKAVFVENPEKLETLRGAAVRHWILLTGWADGVLTLEDLQEMGRDALARDPELLHRMRDEVQPSDPAVLYLTSGATGEPKMALVSHESIVNNIDMGTQALPVGPGDCTVAFLPSAHIAQRVVMEYLPIRYGMPVTFPESLLRLPQEIRRVRPTILLAPPRMWERIYATICTEIRKRSPAAQKAFYAALAMGLAAARYRREGKRVPLRLAVPLKAADAVFFRPIRARFGGRLRVPASGAAPLGKDLAEFYEAIGMPLIEGYGLTEGGVAVLNPLDAPRPGSIGKPLPGVEIRLSGDHEILLKSPCLFMGYWNDPKTTTEVLEDGWLHTGDIGYVDPDGYVFITARKKEMIISSTGKKIYPARVEGLLKMEPIINQVLLIGDRLPYLTALITVNPAAAEGLSGMEEWKGRSGAEVSQAPPVLAEVQKAVARVNQQLAQFEKVRRYRVLARDFSIAEGELTATMKVRRQQAMENFRSHIEDLYEGRDMGAE